MTRTRAGLLTCGVVAVLGLVLRIPTIAEPLGIDQSLLSSAARALDRGMMLYRDVWDQKPPGIFLTYLLGFKIFGWHASSVAWHDLTAAALTTLLLFFVVRRIAPTTTAALASALYSALTIPSWLYRTGGILERSVTETFITVCAGCAAWCAVVLVSGKDLGGHKTSEVLSRAPAIGLGLAAGLAVVYKPNAGVYLLAFLVWVLCYWPAGAPGRWRALVVAVLAASVPTLAAIAWMWKRDVLPQAWVALIEFNRFYVGEGLSIPSYALKLARAIDLRMRWEDPLWAAGGLGSLILLWDFVRDRRLAPAAGLAVAWGAAAFLTIATNGSNLFNTYFSQALAPLSILAAWVLVDSARRSWFHRSAAIVTAAVMFSILVAQNYVPKVWEFLRLDTMALTGRIDRDTYLLRFGSYANNRGYSALANAQLADYIRARTAPDDRIYLFGINGAGIYFNADRLLAHRFLRVNEFVPTSFPNPEFTLPAVTSELAATRPVYLIFERLHSTTAMGIAVDHLEDTAEIQTLLRDYRLETTIEDFRVYRRLTGS